ncbi:MAG: BrnT family toxin [Pseudomonadota bacterium]
MKISYDSEKHRRNVAERNLSFERAADLEWETASIMEDARESYPERRFVATGYLDGRLHVLCFTPTGDGIRVISFRKANKRETKRYEETTQTPDRS